MASVRSSDQSTGWPSPSAVAAVPPLLARQRNVILALLVALTVAGWGVFLNQAMRPSSMGTTMGMTGGMDAGGRMDSIASPDLTMGGSWLLFLVMWVAMMVAMMLPAAAPMVLMYGRMRRDDPRSVLLFSGTYLALWVAFGGLAYALSAGIDHFASRSAWVDANWGRGGGILLVLAGVYQLTPLKAACLRHCRSPLAFVAGHWRDGRRGAIRMGLVHGMYCMGCCWLLFVILVPLGVMNVLVMIVVTTLVFAEKVLPGGRQVSLVASVVLIAYGIAVMSHPSLLPTVA